ncbi:MAG: hypothetical protein HGA35_06435, partial [Erysipelotrichaceae bacterium]|nr:hypothetical protein [Erysipelotrichaceae bacterium]
ANIVSIGAKQSITVGAENKILVQGDDFHVVKAGKNTSVDSAIKTECGKSSEEKIGDNKVLQIAKDLMRKCKKSVTQCEEWLAKATSKVKVVTETLDIISNAARHYMQSGAVHSANDLSLKVEKNSSLVVDGDFGLHVKGILRIRADGGIKIMSEKDIVIGAIEELIIGSKKEKVRSIAKPKKITHEEKSDGFDPPKIDVVVEDLSKMDKEVPEVPEVEVPTTQFEKPEQPENPVRPQDAQLPPLPQIGDFVNNRKDWAGEDSQGE